MAAQQDRPVNVRRDDTRGDSLTLTPCEAVDRNTSCSVSVSSLGTAASRSGCSGTTTRSGWSGLPVSIRPADTASQASQLAQLNRVVALKDLGFSLQQVQAIIDERVSAVTAR
jgi:hypothetical protein